MALVVGSIFAVLLTGVLVWNLRSGRVWGDDPIFSAEKQKDPKRYWTLIAMNVLVMTAFWYLVFKNL